MDVMLEKLLSSFGVSGHEKEVRRIIKNELMDNNYDIKEDKMGNLIVRMGDGPQKFMFCAHMDQIGLIVTYIEESGFIRVGSLGDFKCSDIVHNFIRFQNGIIGKVGTSKDNPDIGDLFIDIGKGSREEVIKLVREGEVACFIGHAVGLDKRVVGPGLDNRVGCYILLRMIKEIKELNKEIYFVFSSQAELGGRGARAASFSIEPDYCIVVDLEASGDFIGGKGNIRLGKGPIVTVIDKSLIIHHEVKEMLESAAKEKAIGLQYALSERVSDGGTIHKEKSGVKTGVVSIPCRYNHSISEMVSLEDVEKTIELLKALL